MSALRVAAFSGAGLLLVIACGGAINEPVTPMSLQPIPLGPVAPGAVCASFSVASKAACPVRKIPSGRGSDPNVCESDADCKDQPGMSDGRCIRNSYFGRARSSPAQNLLADAPRPPPSAICAYDACHSDKDCGGLMRCACGSGVGADRNVCVYVDQCTADRDCGKDHVCTCATSRYTGNQCIDGNCHEDKDCEGGSKCQESHCHTKDDACATDADCPRTALGPPRECKFDVDSRHFACREIEIRPPG